MKCSNCKKKLKEDWKICPRCGNKISDQPVHPPASNHRILYISTAVILAIIFCAEGLVWFHQNRELGQLNEMREELKTLNVTLNESKEKEDGSTEKETEEKKAGTEKAETENNTPENEENRADKNSNDADSAEQSNPVPEAVDHTELQIHHVNGSWTVENLPVGRTVQANENLDTPYMDGLYTSKSGPFYVGAENRSSSAIVLHRFFLTYAKTELSPDQLISELQIDPNVGAYGYKVQEVINRYLNEYRIPAYYNLGTSAGMSVTDDEIQLMIERLIDTVDGGYPVIVCIKPSGSANTKYTMISGYETDSEGRLTSVLNSNGTGEFGSFDSFRKLSLDELISQMTDFAGIGGFMQYLY